MIEHVTARNARLGYVLVITAAVLFGINGGLSRVAMGSGLSPESFTTVRVTGATLVFIAYAACFRRSALRRPKGTAMLQVIALGLVGVAALQLTYNVAIDRLPLGIALLIEYLAPVPTSGTGSALRVGGTALAVGGTAYSAYAFSEDISEGHWGSAALNGTSFAGGGLALGGTAAGSSTLVTAGTVIGAPAAVFGAAVAGWQLGEFTNQNTAISDVAAAGGSAVERLTGSTTLGAVGAAGTAILAAPVFVPIAVAKGVGRGASWLWNKVF